MDILELIARGGPSYITREADQTRASTDLARSQSAHAQQATLTEQQDTEAKRIENQARAVSIKDNGIIRDAMTQVERQENEPESQYLGRITSHARKNGISAGGYIGLTKNLAGALETQSKLKGEELDQHKKSVELGGPLLQSLATAAPDQTDAVYAQVQPALNQLEPGHFPAQLPTDPAERKTLLDSWMASHGVNASLLGLKKAAADVAHTDALTAGQTATTAGTLQSTANAADLHPALVRAGEATATSAEQKAGGTVPIQPVERANIDAQTRTADEAHRHNLSTEQTAKLQAAIAGGHLAQEQMVNGVKYGPDTAAYWAEQLAQNPDSISELPADMRTSVGKAFTAKTGLPLPKPLTGEGLTQERAARNALDGAARIQQLVSDPEIAGQIGPIMGRLGNAEQKIGTAVGLSPRAEALAQELRTQMRYFVFQEGKAVLGGRLPQNLMKSLEDSSANVHMDSNMLKGALTGAVENAHTVMDNSDRQRFGGKMRSREARGQGTPKEFPAGQVHAYAQAHGMTDEAAKASIQASGYTVK